MLGGQLFHHYASITKKTGRSLKHGPKTASGAPGRKRRARPGNNLSAKATRTSRPCRSSLFAAAEVVGPVGVGGDAGPLVGLDAILVDHPIHRGAVAQAVIKHFRRDAAEGERVVYLQ